MAKRQGAVEDIVEIAAKLPWWVGVLLALVAFAVLHSVAAMEITAPNGVQGLGDFAVKQFIRTLAVIGQYSIPLALLVGAAMSAYGRRKRRGLHLRVSTSNEAGILDGMSWQEFEMLVGEAFRRKGFIVRETGGAGPDGGVDLVLSAGTEKYLVQCKQWRALKVPVTTVRELYGVMADKHASGGIVVTSGTFTKDAEEFAKGRNIELIDRAKLLQLIQDARLSLGASRVLAPAPDAWSNPVAEAEGVARAMTPAFPLCGSVMTQRIAKRGANAGKPFWGCSNFARSGCRGTLPSI
jgi:restriction system protein